MGTFLVLVLMAACFTTIESKVPLHNKQRRNIQPVYRFPKDFRVENSPDLAIPSKAFCEAQAMKPHHHYLVLPWWYHLCQNYLEKELKPYRDGKYYLPLYRRVLDKALQYKKYKKTLDQHIHNMQAIIQQ